MEVHLKELAQVPIEAIKHQPFIENLRFQCQRCLLSKRKIKSNRIHSSRSQQNHVQDRTFWKIHKQLLHYSSPMPKLLSALIKHNKHHKLPGNAHLPSKSISFNGIKSITSANQVDGSIFKRTCSNTYWGNYSTTMGRKSQIIMT